MSSTENNRKYYQKRKAAGLCVECGQPADKDRTRCAACREKARVKANQRYRDMTKAERRRVCLMQSEHNYVQYHERKAVGLCVYCGKQKDTDGVYCVSCRDNVREYNHRMYPVKYKATWGNDVLATNNVDKPGNT